MKSVRNTPEVSLLVRKGGKLLFVLREHTGYCDGYYALPGGHVEPGESFSTAAVREAKEEVGVHIDPQKLAPVHAMHRISPPEDVRVGMFFRAKAWSGTPRNMEPERHAAIAWFDEDDLPFGKIMPFQAAALRRMADGETYSELGWG